jgi:POT family proton-dependent oligopeptide transporter
MYVLHTFGELSLSPIGLSMVNKLAPVRFASLLMGVWFLSNAAANKFAGVLSGLYPDPSKPAPVLMGYQINDLYSFFTIFIVMAAAASLILFLIYKRLLKMMHGVN